MICWAKSPSAVDPQKQMLIATIQFNASDYTPDMAVETKMSGMNRWLPTYIAYVARETSHNRSANEGCP